MTERRRETVRREIARAAVGLFTANGVQGTTGDDIARAVGISTRTLWRYFPTKESCVRPLLTEGLDLVAAHLRACPARTPLLEYLEQERFFGRGAPPMEAPVMDLVRMTRTEPGLMAVWLEVHHAAEAVFADIIAARSGARADDLSVRVQAAVLNAALRLAAEEQARRPPGSPDAPSDGVGSLVRTALAAAACGLPAFGHGPQARPNA
ncbi:TetR family transcriptional regulator [Nocardiopsis sp. TSRI0078]|uniref:TetR/AcrR family transcriptional regulator n=1 Tax=unclassified Nocardiopsis TaxID=2649073 RepID=UPI00093A448F|nr:TetR/AcrR family transcriptional regulator [Nocardiopsis sp. TSRI0078]OKI15755.1 TetR family transcriptional regulator [Nocardiopsis sp. TSRI0078]